MSSLNSANPEPQPHNNSATSLVVSLSAVPSARLTHEISIIVKRTIKEPFTFLGSVGDIFKLDLHLRDPGQVATEALARRLLKLKGVSQLKAERLCPRRGAIYAIFLKSPIA
jgi:hypothetical protein